MVSFRVLARENNKNKNPLLNAFSGIKEKGKKGRGVTDRRLILGEKLSYYDNCNPVLLKMVF